MSTLIPTASACHTLQLPPIEKDDRLNLNVRTGAAAVLYNSFVFTFGGLTIGLELDDKLSIADISAIFRRETANKKIRKMRNYLSGEIFYLDLISRTWSRIAIPANSPRPAPRMFHELATGVNCLYLFGGLALAEESEGNNSFRLAPLNDLWEFNILTKSWKLLHDGADWKDNQAVPKPRFCHKMTSITHLSFINKMDHFGLMIAGGLDQNSAPIYANSVFDLVDNKYVEAGPPLTFPPVIVNGESVPHFKTTNDSKNISINYFDSVILNFNDEVENVKRDRAPNSSSKTTFNESIFIYSPTLKSSTDEVLNPLLQARVGKHIKQPKIAPLHKKKNLKSRKFTYNLLRRTVPFNLRYPTGGVFGQNLVIIGFLPDDYDISIFIYNKPTGKWSRLNIFCNHEYGSHRFWGGFVWRSHHKVILLGNYVTSRTTSSVRFFSSLITVSLPVTNILASLELAGDRLPSQRYNRAVASDSSSLSETDFSAEEISSSSMSQSSDIDELLEKPPKRRFSNISEAQKSSKLHTATFNDYVHYAAPKVNFTKVRSVFPPAAITLGRNAFDRYGGLISDFEFISSNGDRIPVCLSVLMARWGKYFINLLAQAYVKAIDQFEHDQIQNESHQKLRSSKSSGSSSGSHSWKHRNSSTESSHLANASHEHKTSHHLQLSNTVPSQKEAPHFRLPFQEKSAESLPPPNECGVISIDPHNKVLDRRGSAFSNSSNNSMLISHLKDLPSQLPMPSEPIPDVPATPQSYRSSSRKNSAEGWSPRASVLHTLTVLRSIPPAKSPRSSPADSPRHSISGQPERSDTSSGGGTSTHSEDEGGHLDLSPMHAKLSVKDPKISLDESLAGRSFDSSRNVYSGSDGSGNRSSSSLIHEVPVSEPQKGESPSLLNFENIDSESFNMEPSLIPRKLYIPFCTDSLRAFAEYLYTGQIGNKWTLQPCALDCMWISRYFKVPLLYDLVCEVLYGIIGRKEALVIKEGKRLKRKFLELMQKMNLDTVSSFKFPLDEYEGFLDTVDDGYLDIALLLKTSNVHKSSISSRSSQGGVSSLKTAESHSKLSSNSPMKSPKSPKSVRNEEGHSSPELTSDESSSANDDNPTPLLFLDNTKKSSISSRQRSMFDKTVYETVSPSQFQDENGKQHENDGITGVTLEMLVSPDSPEPSNYVIDIIHETASICTDVKLMLRSINARQMGLALAQAKRDYSALEKSWTEEENYKQKRTEKYEDTNAAAELLNKTREMSESASEAKEISKGFKGARYSTDDELNRVSSSSNLANLKMKDLKAGRAESNRKLDKQIAQMIRKEEKLKLKTARGDKEKKQPFDGRIRTTSATASLEPSKSGAEPASDIESIRSHKHLHPVSMARSHTSPISSTRTSDKTRSKLFKKLHLPKHAVKETETETQTPGDRPILSRTDSRASETSSSSKRSGSSKISTTSMRGIFSSRKNK